MVQRTVLKVDVSCFKCKKKILKAVSSLQGVDEMEVDPAKGTLTVTGNADPYEIIVRTRKAGKSVEVVSIGPPPPPPKPDAQKKPDEKKPDDRKPDAKAQVHVPQPYICPVCERMAVGYLDRHEDPSMACSIL